MPYVIGIGDIDSMSTISPTFYQQFMRWYSYVKKLNYKAQLYEEKSEQKYFRMKKLFIPKCWWNWLLVDNDNCRNDLEEKKNISGERMNT